MKKLLFSCLMVAVAATASAQVEKSYMRVNVGYVSSTATQTLTNVDWSDATTAPVYKDMKGVNAGYTYGLNLTKKAPVYVEFDPKLTFLFSSANSINMAQDLLPDEEDIDAMTQEGTAISVVGKANDFMMHFNLPINLTYKINCGKGWYVAPYAGMHIKFNIIGRTQYTVKVLETAKDENDEESVTEYGTFSDSQNWFSDSKVEDGGMGSKANTYNRIQYGWQCGVNVGCKKVNVHLGWDWDSALYNNWDYVTASSTKWNTRSFQVGLGYNF